MAKQGLSVQMPESASPCGRKSNGGTLLIPLCAVQIDTVCTIYEAGAGRTESPGGSPAQMHRALSDRCGPDFVDFCEEAGPANNSIFARNSVPSLSGDLSFADFTLVFNQSV